MALMLQGVAFMLNLTTCPFCWLLWALLVFPVIQLMPWACQNSPKMEHGESVACNTCWGFGSTLDLDGDDWWADLGRRTGRRRRQSWLCLHSPFWTLFCVIRAQTLRQADQSQSLGTCCIPPGLNLLWLWLAAYLGAGISVCALKWVKLTDLISWWRGALKWAGNLWKGNQHHWASLRMLLGWGWPSRTPNREVGIQGTWRRLSQGQAFPTLLGSQSCGRLGFRRRTGVVQSCHCCHKSANQSWPGWWHSCWFYVICLPHTLSLQVQ